MIISAIKKRVKKNYRLYYAFRFHKYKKNAKKIDRMSIEGKKAYLDNKYYMLNGNYINWDNPRKFSEKVQYLKLFGEKDEIYAKLADKYAVRDWVKQKIGDEYLIPLIGVYDAFDDISYDDLPKAFVIKCTHDSGSVMIVKDKSKINWRALKFKYDYHMKTDFYYFTLEKHYSLIQPRIIIEEYIEDSLGKQTDYKFLCFNSQPYSCSVDYNRFEKRTRNTYDLDWNILDWNFGEYNKSAVTEKPQNFEKMAYLANVLCEGFSMVRVDFYNIDGKIYFGEMTFTPASGLVKYSLAVDKKLGDMWGEYSDS